MFKVSIYLLFLRYKYFCFKKSRNSENPEKSENVAQPYSSWHDFNENSVEPEWNLDREMRPRAIRNLDENRSNILQEDIVPSAPIQQEIENNPPNYEHPPTYEEAIISSKMPWFGFSSLV